MKRNAIRTVGSHGSRSRPPTGRGILNRVPGNSVMRSLLAFGLVALVAAPAPDAIDPEAKPPYQLRVIVRTGDHPALTKHFRADVKKSVGSALQTGLGGLGTVEVIDLNETPADQLDPLARLAGEKGLEALETVSVTAPAKTHF